MEFEWLDLEVTESLLNRNLIFYKLLLNVSLLTVFMIYYSLLMNGGVFIFVSSLLVCFVFNISYYLNFFAYFNASSFFYYLSFAYCSFMNAHTCFKWLKELLTIFNSIFAGSATSILNLLDKTFNFLSILILSMHFFSPICIILIF